MKTRWYVACGLAVLVLAGSFGWYLRSQTVVWGISQPNLQVLLTSVGPDLTIRAAESVDAPWDKPDLILRWIDPWEKGSPDPFVRTVSGPPPRELLAFEVFGLFSSRQATPPADFKTWAADLDKTTAGSAPLAVAAKSDNELLNLVLWFGEGVLGPENLQTSLASLAADPSASVDPSGTLPSTHPWMPVLEEMKRWSASGRLIPLWWDLSDLDVVAAVVEGKARWGLGWSGVHVSTSQSGVPLSSLRLVPAWPGRRSSSLLGRWLILESGAGWADPAKAAEARGRLSSVPVGQGWLKQGLLMADPNLPAVNQETKALSVGLLSAGALISAPSAATDLAPWKPLLEAVRTVLRK